MVFRQSKRDNTTYIKCKMKNIITEIRNFLIGANKKYPNIKFKLGYGDSEDVFIVDVRPYSEFRSNEGYAKMESGFCDLFSEKYPNFDLIFVSEGDICAIEKLICKVGYYMDISPEQPHKFNFEDDYNCNCVPQQDYALAA